MLRASSSLACASIAITVLLIGALYAQTWTTGRFEMLPMLVSAAAIALWAAVARHRRRGRTVGMVLGLVVVAVIVVWVLGVPQPGCVMCRPQQPPGAPSVVTVTVATSIVAGLVTMAAAALSRARGS